MGVLYAFWKQHIKILAPLGYSKMLFYFKRLLHICDVNPRAAADSVNVCFWVSGSGTLCASWQCLEVPRGPPPSLAVQFVGSGASLAGLDVELVGSRYRMSLVKKRFATGGSQTYFLSLISSSFQFRIVYSVGYLVTRWLLGCPLDGCFLV